MENEVCVHRKDVIYCSLIIIFLLWGCYGVATTRIAVYEMENAQAQIPARIK